MKGNGKFVAGFVGGAAAAFTIAASCQQVRSSDAVPSQSAANVSFANAHSGLKSSDVQSALDEIGTTAHAALAFSLPSDQPGPAQPTKWAIQQSEVTQDGALLKHDGGTVTFTETTPGEGTYVVSGANAIAAGGFSGMPNAQPAKSGKYYIIGDQLIAVADSTNAAGKIVWAWALRISDGGKTISLASGLGNVSGYFVVLNKQPG